MNNKVHETQCPESSSRVVLGQVVPWRSRGGWGGSACLTRGWGLEVRVRATSPTPPSASGYVWLHWLESLRLLHSGPTAGRRQRDDWGTPPLPRHHMQRTVGGAVPGAVPETRCPGSREQQPCDNRHGRTAGGSAGSSAPAVPQALRKPGAAPPTPGDTAVGERRVEASRSLSERPRRQQVKVLGWEQVRVPEDSQASDPPGPQRPPRQGRQVGSRTCLQEAGTSPGGPDAAQKAGEAHSDCWALAGTPGVTQTTRLGQVGGLGWGGGPSAAEA